MCYELSLVGQSMVILLGSLFFCSLCMLLEGRRGLLVVVVGRGSFFCQAGEV